MLENTRIQYGLIIVGIVGVLLSVLIDPIRGFDIYLHPVQIVVLIASIILALAGLYLAFVRKPAA